MDVHLNARSTRGPSVHELDNHSVKQEVFCSALVAMTIGAIHFRIITQAIEAGKESCF